MNEKIDLTERFEESRPQLHAVAYRMLGSLSEAEDAVQEAWLRLHRTDATTIDNLGGWLTTVVARVCLDVLRSRRSRREEPLRPDQTEPRALHGADPEREVLIADSVGVALLVVLETLTPAERLAFVLHDLFATPFAEIGVILDRSPDAVRQLASRARRRVQGGALPATGTVDRTRQREVVEAFLAAARSGDLERLLDVLDPDAVIRIDAAARLDAPPEDAGRPREVRGASKWAPQLLALSRQSPFVVQPAVVDGSVGLISAPLGNLARAFVFAFEGDKVVRLEVIADPGRLGELEIALPWLPDEEPARGGRAPA